MRNPVIIWPLKFLGANDNEKEIGHQGNAGEENDDFNHPYSLPQRFAYMRQIEKKRMITTV
jgi:hypothetical protein